MTTAEIIEIVIGSGGVLGITFIIFRMGALVEKIKHMDGRIDTLDKKIEAKFEKVDGRFDKIENGIRSIDVRLSVLEAKTIIYNMIKDPNSKNEVYKNRRSEAAKNRWEKKRAQQIEYATSGKLME